MGKDPPNAYKVHIGDMFNVEEWDFCTRSSPYRGSAMSFK